MLLKFFFSIGVTTFMMYLVFIQMRAANEVELLTVEQLKSRGLAGLSFDRHYAMVLDFCIIAPFTGLVLFLCAKQLSTGPVLLAALVSAAFSVGICYFWYHLPGLEAHNQSLGAAIYHGLFLMLALWALILMNAFTPKPEPVLLLIACVVVPAFFFVGTHMYLGLIDWEGWATSFEGEPFKDKLGWTIIIIATALQWWRAYVLIPTSFWDTVR